VRCDNNSKLQDSAPCQNCLTTILELNIKRIVFSYKDNTFISCNPKELTINHISAGNNFIKRLHNNTNTNTNTHNTNTNTHNTNTNTHNTNTNNINTHNTNTNNINTHKNKNKNKNKKIINTQSL
jgi:deoxycytidylate deaminase